jgi:hypothetical protein
MCKRSAPDDPLARLFFEQYHMNLLPMPRADARCGELYVKRGRRMAAVPGDLQQLITPAVELPAPVAGQPMPDIAGTRSSAVSATVGLGLLEAFLVALGVTAGLVQEVRAGFDRHRVRDVRFQFRDATRDAIDPFTIASALIGHGFDPRHPWVGPGNRYFVSAAVVRSSAISIVAHDERGATVDAGADVLAAVQGDAKVVVERAAGGEITYQGGDRPLAIAVELYDLAYDEQGGRFVMGEADDAVELRRGRELELPAAFPAEDDELLLALDDLDGVVGAPREA